VKHNFRQLQAVDGMTSLDKNYVRRLIADIEEAMEIVLEDLSKPFNSISRAEKSEVRYYLIVMVEALVALCYHLSRRAYNITPGSSIEAFKVLMDRGLLTSEEFDDFAKLARLRNLLVHRYWIIDDRRIYYEVKKNFKHVKNFIEKIRRVLSV